MPTETDMNQQDVDSEGLYVLLSSETGNIWSIHTSALSALREVDAAGIDDSAVQVRFFRFDTEEMEDLA